MTTKRSPEGFVHLHTHSDYSTLDGCAKVDDYVKAAAERGNPAVALTDHGTMRGAFALTESCKKRGVKPVYGVELYVCDDMARRGLTDAEKNAVAGGEQNKARRRELIKAEEERAGVRRTAHLTAWALTNEGLRNLYRLTSKAWDGGYYYRPRVDVDAICAHADGVAVGTGCVGSAIYGAVFEKRPRKADAIFGKLDDAFGDRLYLEVMPHSLRDYRQHKANRHALFLRQFAKHRLLATQDAHYIAQKDARHHDVLLAIGTHDVLGDPERFRFDGSQFWFKTREEMAQSFARDHPYIEPSELEEALESTVELAGRCDALIGINPLKCLLPPVELPDGFADEYKYLEHLVVLGKSERGMSERVKRLAEREGVSYRHAHRRYVERAGHELNVLRKSGFVAYFLILRDLYQWVRKEGIARGPGRGSAAGSLVAFLLGITDVDPIEHRLLFERFIAPGRINMPDIDCDFADDRRAEIVEYLREKYGEDKVAGISTMGEMKGRQALRDVARVYEIPFQRAAVAAGAIPDEPGGDSAIEEAVQRSEHFRKFREEYPTVVRHAAALEGITKTIAQHAAGVVTSPVPLVDVVPVEVRRPPGGEVRVTAFDMRGVEGIGLLKIDVLGLKTVTLLEDARRMVESRTGREWDLLDLPLDDRETLDAFTARDFVGVFQFDTPSSHSVCDGMKFEVFDDIAAVNAINRPGALAFADEFKKRRKDAALARRDVFHPKVSEITRDSLGLMIYQEHVIRVLTDVAGYSPADADKLRKKIGKSEGEAALEVERGVFTQGCRETTKDMDRDTAERLFDAIVKFGRYGFNRAHAVCYSMLAYWTMYLKRHHPIEFYCALMRRESDAQKIQRYAKDAKGHGVDTLLPDVNVSGAGFSVDYGASAVRGSLIEIKGLGEAAVGAIVEERERGGPFKDAVDFVARCRSKKVTKRTVDALARSGALDSLVPNPRWFAQRLGEQWKHFERGRSEQVRMAMERSASAHQWTEKQRLIEAAEVNPLATPPHPLIDWEPWLRRNVKVPLSELSAELLAEQRSVFVAGAVTELEEREVGDTKSLDEFPDEEVREAIGWGKPWLRLTLAGLNFSCWVKLDWQLVDEFRDAVDRPGREAPVVLVSARTRPDWQNLDAHFVAGLDRLADGDGVAALDGLTLWERMFVSHPAETYPFDSKADRRLAQKNLVGAARRATGWFSVIGVVSRLFERRDKRRRLMAWLGISGPRDYIDVVCFGSAWPEYRAHIKRGALVKLRLKKLDDGTVVLEDRPGSVRLYEKEATCRE